MIPIAEAAIFNLRAVVRETNLKPDTLRAWERRYGLPRPRRSAGGQRLYSQRDIDTLKWLVARQEEGLSISRAAELWWEVMEREPQGPGPELSLPAAAVSPDAGLDALRADWLGHCAAFREAEAERVLAQAQALYSVEAVCARILQQGIAELNDRWYRGQATIQQVYLASELAVRHIQGLLASAAPPARPGRVLVACAPHESHTLAPLLVTLLLRRQGWDALYLGANVPLEGLQATLDAVKPDLVILTAQQLTTAATLLEAARQIAGARIRVGYGGWIFNVSPVVRSHIPGHFVGESLADGVRAVGRLLAEPFRAPSAERVPAEYHEALVHYLSRQLAIEARVRKSLEKLNLPAVQVTDANDFFGRNLGAALTFGDMSLLDQEVLWLEGLFSNHRVLVGSLYKYLHAYFAAAKAHLDDRGRPVITWLAQITGHES